MGVLRMINTLNANKNIGIVLIRLDSNHKWNSEILTLIKNRYTNMHSIHLRDYND